VVQRTKQHQLNRPNQDGFELHFGLSCFGIEINSSYSWISASAVSAMCDAHQIDRIDFNVWDDWAAHLTQAHEAALIFLRLFGDHARNHPYHQASDKKSWIFTCF
jgi:hypothetical protein